MSRDTLMINRDSCPRRCDQVIAQKAENDFLLLNMEDGNYYSLNEIGGRVWQLCDGTHTVSQVVSVLAAEFDAPYPVLEKDVVDLLEDFRKGKLIA